MATITAAVPGGDWGSTSSWVGSSIPGDGDDVIIPAGSTITVSDAQTVGTNVAATYAIQIQASAALTIQDGGILACRGDVFVDRVSFLTVEGGGVFELDSSATAPTSTQYRIRQEAMEPGGDSRNPSIRGRGTSGNRATIRSNAGGGNGYIEGETPGITYSGLVDCEYTDFIRIGDASTSAINAVPESNTGNDYSVFTLFNCSFDACGKLEIQTPGSIAQVSIRNTTWRNSVGTVCVQSNGYGDKDPGGIREFVNCVFDINVNHFSPRDWTFTGNVYQEPFQTSSTDAQGWDEFAGNFMAMDAGIDQGFYGDATNNYFYYKDLAQVNPHLAHVGGISTIATYKFNNNILEHGGSDSTGDAILVGGSGAAASIEIKGNIVLPNGSGESTGTLFSALGDANVTLVVEQNTAFLGTGGGAAVGETYIGHAGMLASFKNNLFWDTSARAYKLFDSGTNDSVTDLVASGQADYNAAFNALTAGNGYNNLEFSSGDPGDNDITDDPSFYDSARDLASWDLSLGGIGTATNAINEMAKLNDSDFDSNYTLANLLAYIREGFAPTASAYSASGYLSQQIGAVAYTAPESTVDDGSGLIPSPGVATPTSRVYFFGRDLTFTYYPMDASGHSVTPVGSPRIYLYNTRPSREQAQTGLAFPLQYLAAWDLDHGKAEFTFSAVNDPEPFSDNDKQVYFVAINYYLKSGGQLQTDIRAITIQRPKGQLSELNVAIEDLEAYFPTLDEYISETQQALFVANGKTEVKRALTHKGYEWAKIHNPEALQSALIQRVLSDCFKAMIVDGQDGFDRLYDIAHDEYQALLSSVRLEYDADNDGEPEQVKTIPSTVIITK